MIYVLIILLIIIIYFVCKWLSKPSSGHSSNYTDTSSRRSASDSTIYPNRKRLYTDELTKKSFITYIIGSVINVDYQNHIMDFDEGYYWAKPLIEQAWEHITTGSCINYSQVGRFNLYEGQTLTPENKVYMDLFEKLIYGDNNSSINRANELSDEDADKLRFNLWTLSLMLTSNDGEIRQRKIDSAAIYDGIFG